MSEDLLGKTLALLCALLWAVAVIFFKRSGETIRPLALNFYKSAVSVILLIPVMLVMKTPWMPEGLSAREFIMVISSGIIGITIADSLFFKSLNLIGAGLSAIVDCLYSPMLILFSFLFLHENVTLRELSGGFLVVTAIMIATIQVEKRKRSSKTIVFGVILGMVAMVAVAASVILMKSALDTLPLLLVTEIRLIAAGISLFFLMWINRDRTALFNSLKTPSTWRLAFPGTFIGNILAMLLWMQAFKMTDVSIAAILNQTSTIFIVILAAYFLNEKFTPRRIIAVIMAFTGAIIAMTS